jgi:hypothetical protein
MLTAGLRSNLQLRLTLSISNFAGADIPSSKEIALEAQGLFPNDWVGIDPSCVIFVGQMQSKWFGAQERHWCDQQNIKVRDEYLPVGLSKAGAVTTRRTLVFDSEREAAQFKIVWC